MQQLGQEFDIRGANFLHSQRGQALQLVPERVGAASQILAQLGCPVLFQVRRDL